MQTAIRLFLAAAALGGLAACVDTTAATGAAGGSEGGVPFGTYTMVGFGKEAAPNRDVSLRLGPGTITGNGPCNSFTAANTRSLPDIFISQMTWTDNPCSALDNYEARVFQALTQAQRAEWQGGVLKIIGPTYMTLERTGN